MLPSNGKASNLPLAGDGEQITLGMIQPDAEALDAIRDRWVFILEHAGVPEFERTARTPLPLASYLFAVENTDRANRDARRHEALTWQVRETGRGVAALHVLGDQDQAVIDFVRQEYRPDFTPDAAGYRRYLDTRMPVDDMIENWESCQQVAAFPEIGRTMHTLVVAATGHGKSELLKALLFHYAQRPGSAGVLVIDPGRTLAEDVARWPELHRDNRVIYVEPELRDGLTVGFNPFHNGHLVPQRQKSHLAEAIGQAIGEMSMDLSDHMKTMVANCAMVLLDQPDATLRDLGRMVAQPPTSSPFGKFRDERRDHLLQAAYDHDDEYVREFFQYRFDAPTYASVRDALAARLDRVTGMIDVRHALYGPATIDLERELDAGKFVIVNLAKYGEDEQRAAMGRLLVTMVAAIGNRRAQRARPYMPLHLVVDEVTTMATGKMVKVLNELRRFGVHATFAQQTDAEGFTRDQARSLIRNTRCRLAAMKNHREGAEFMDNEVTPDELPRLQNGQFWVSWEGVPGVHTVQVRSDLAVRNRRGDVMPNPDPARWLPELEWQLYLDWLTREGGHYRPSHVPSARQASPVSPAPRADPVAPAASETPTRPKRTPGRNSRVPPYTVPVPPPEPPDAEKKPSVTPRLTPGKPRKTPSLNSEGKPPTR